VLPVWALISFSLGSGGLKWHNWRYVVIASTCVFVLFFAFSWGPICWLYPAEVSPRPLPYHPHCFCAQIFPMNVRAKAISLSTLANWIMNVCVAEMVPSFLYSCCMACQLANRHRHMEL
jgi:hypothetical protein